MTDRSDEPKAPPEATGELPPHRLLAACLGALAVPVGGYLAAEQLCLSAPLLMASNPWWAYFGLGLVLAGVVTDRVVRRDQRAHKARLEDRSEVVALIVEARLAQKRSNGNDHTQLEDEARRLEELAWKGWTDYRVLPLRRMLVEFLNDDELRQAANSALDELEDYAEDSNFRYDQRLFTKWKTRVEEAEKTIEHNKNDGAADSLRAVLRTLYEHVAEYHANWAEGSALIEGLRICGVAAIPIVLLMSLVPYLHPADDGLLGILNWGLLGVVGSVTAALLGIRRSNLAEVGNTEGRLELARTILGVALGLVAGVLAFGIIAGGLIGGSAVPQIDQPQLEQIALSVVWGIGSGFSFERVFERVRGMTEPA